MSFKNKKKIMMRVKYVSYRITNIDYQDMNTN